VSEDEIPKTEITINVGTAENTTIVGAVLGARVLSSVPTSLGVDREKLLRTANIGLKVDHQQLDAHESIIKALEQASWHVTPGQLLPLVQDQMRMLDATSNHRQKSTHQQRLWSLLGETVALSAWLSYLLENLGDARRYVREAGDLAVLSGNGQLRAHVLGLQSYLHTPINKLESGEYGGMETTAIAMLDAAISIAGSHALPALQAQLAARRAEEAAWIGDAPAAARYLDAAARAMTRAQGQSSDWFEFLDEAQLDGYRGICAVLLKRSRNAETILRKAVRRGHYQQVFQPEAMMIDLAQALAQQGEVDESCRLLADCLRRAEQKGVGIHLQRVVRVRQSFPKQLSSSAVTNLDELLENL
jgi:hypothetical protein